VFQTSTGSRTDPIGSELPPSRQFKGIGEDAAVTERPPGAPGPEAPPHIGDVIRRLRTIEASAPRSDGVVCFARL
jgi:hypothetical protein